MSSIAAERGKSAVLTICILILLWSFPAAAFQSTITEAEGYACMGEDRLRRQTEEAAIDDAKRRAMEFSSTYITSETHVKDFEVQKDLVWAYANGTVKILKEIEKGWYKDQNAGDCFKVKIKAEVIPDEKAIQKVSQRMGVADDPSAV
jgi:hypothetical protein